MVTNNSWNSQDPTQVAKGGTGAATLTGVLTGNGTSPVTANAVTQYGTVIAGASNAVSSVAPSATSGIPYISQGSSSNPTFGTAVVAGGGTGATTLTGVLTGNGTSAITANAVTQYGVLVGGASNAVSSTAVGTAGQVLTSNGAGMDPTFQTNAASGTGWVHLSTQTASASSSIEFTSLISATYDTYVFVWSNDKTSVSASTYLQGSTNNGSSWITSGYASGLTGNNYNGNTWSNNNTTTGILLNTGTLTACGVLTLFQVSSAGDCWGNGTFSYINTPNSGHIQTNTGITSLNALRVVPSTGTLTAGKYSLYGLYRA